MSKYFDAFPRKMATYISFLETHAAGFEPVHGCVAPWVCVGNLNTGVGMTFDIENVQPRLNFEQQALTVSPERSPVSVFIPVFWKIRAKDDRISFPGSPEIWVLEPSTYFSSVCCILLKVWRLWNEFSLVVFPGWVIGVFLFFLCSFPFSHQSYCSLTYYCA